MEQHVANVWISMHVRGVGESVTISRMLITQLSTENADYKMIIKFN